jgi:hypothetical protein
MKCKFCGCTDEKPCQIQIDIDGNLTSAATGIFTVCGWLIDGVCSAPACVEKAYAEAELLSSQIQFWLERESA